MKLKANPLKEIHVNYAYGFSKSYGVKFHNGIDLKALVRTKLFSVDDGIVAFIRLDSPTGGKYVIIEHEGYCSGYYHCNSITVNVEEKVYAGQLIAYSGNTGQSTGAHLHFEIRLGKYDNNYWNKLSTGRYANSVDPEPYLIDEYMTVEGAKNLVQNKAGLNDKTIDYLVSDYKYGEQLIIKLAKAMI